MPADLDFVFKVEKCIFKFLCWLFCNYWFKRLRDFFFFHTHLLLLLFNHVRFKFRKISVSFLNVRLWGLAPGPAAKDQSVVWVLTLVPDSSSLPGYKVRCVLGGRQCLESEPEDRVSACYLNLPLPLTKRFLMCYSRVDNVEAWGQRLTCRQRKSLDSDSATICIPCAIHYAQKCSL